jgi:two-component system sensor histidine kinase UhpB
MTVILRDITERKRAEQVREQLTRQLQSLTERLAMAQEDERGRIAHELHEQLGQELTTLKLYLQMLGPGSSDTDAANSHKEALAMAVHATERVRKLVLDLEPPELTHFGLHAAVRGYSQRQAMAGGWKLNLEVPKPKMRASRSVERACFRLLQEGMSNILLHAQASEVWVRLHHGANELELSIRDNGIGFDCGEADGNMGDGGSLGLFGMQIRAKLAGGWMRIESAPGAGTEVRAVFPLHPGSAQPD